MKTLKFLKFCSLIGIVILTQYEVFAQRQMCSSVTCFVQYQGVEAGLSKGGFQEFTDPELPRVRWYHNQTTSVSYGYSYPWSDSNGCGQSGDEGGSGVTEEDSGSVN